MPMLQTILFTSYMEDDYDSKIEVSRIQNNHTIFAIEINQDETGTHTEYFDGYEELMIALTRHFANLIEKRELRREASFKDGRDLEELPYYHDILSDTYELWHDICLPEEERFLLS